MTIVKNEQADSFIDKPPGRIALFLIHGNETGLVHERSKRLVEHLSAGDDDPFRIVRLDGDALARDPGRLPDEAHNPSLFGGRRTLWIDAKGKDLAAALEPLVARPPEASAIVVETGSLKKGQPLRTLFESAPTAAAIECYLGNSEVLRRLALSEIKAANLTVSEVALEFLVELLTHDSELALGEMRKLALYCLSSGTIEIDDIREIVAGISPPMVETLIDGAFEGNLAKAETSASKFYEEAGESGLLMFRLLSRVLDQMDRAAGGASSRPRFPPYGAPSNASAQWSAAEISAVAPNVLELSARTRGAGLLSRELMTRALWALAAQGRQRRR